MAKKKPTPRKGSPPDTKPKRPATLRVADPTTIVDHRDKFQRLLNAIKEYNDLPGRSTQGLVLLALRGVLEGIGPDGKPTRILFRHGTGKADAHIQKAFTTALEAIEELFNWFRIPWPPGFPVEDWFNINADISRKIPPLVKKKLTNALKAVSDRPTASKSKSKRQSPKWGRMWPRVLELKRAGHIDTKIAKTLNDEFGPFDIPINAGALRSERRRRKKPTPK